MERTTPLIKPRALPRLAVCRCGHVKATHSAYGCEGLLTSLDGYWTGAADEEACSCQGFKAVAS